MPGRLLLSSPPPPRLPSWAAGAVVLAVVGLAMLILPAASVSLGPSGPASRAEVRLAAVALRGALRVRDGTPDALFPPPEARPVTSPVPPADALRRAGPVGGTTPPGDAAAPRPVTPAIPERPCP